MGKPDASATAGGWDKVDVERAADLALNAYGLGPEYRPALSEPRASWRGDTGGRPNPGLRSLAAHIAASIGPSPLQSVGATARAIAIGVHGASSRPPVGAWSIHPVASSVVHSAEALGPTLASLERSARARRATTSGEAGAPAVRPATGVTTTAEHGIIVLERALLRDRSGKPVALIRQVGPTIEAEFYGEWPESIAQALVGRAATSLCNLFDADPRGGGAVIESAKNVAHGSRTRLRVRFEDSLVPVLPWERGGEEWRPTRSAGLVNRPRAVPNAHQFRHAFAAMGSAYAGPGSCIPTTACQSCGP